MASGSGSNQDPVKNIVLVGRTGNGKSATGNSILGTTAFISEAQAAGVTTRCQTCRAAIRNGPIINVIDTPGLFDLMADPEQVSKEIVRCLALAEEGIHAVVFVVTVRSRLSQEEEDTLCKLQSLFGSRILDYMIVLYTGGDELAAQGRTLADYFRNGVPEFMQRVLRLCNDRQVVFDNKTQDETKKTDQRNELLAKVSEIEEFNNGIPFTDERHRQIRVENILYRRKQREVETQNLTTEELIAIKLRLEEEHEESMKELSDLVKESLFRRRIYDEMIQMRTSCNIL